MATDHNQMPRRLSADTIAKLRAELNRLSKSSNPRVRKLIQAMREKYPGLV